MHCKAHGKIRSSENKRGENKKRVRARAPRRAFISFHSALPSPPPPTKARGVTGPDARRAADDDERDTR